jgi:membrane AbrB-like protein
MPVERPAALPDPAGGPAVALLPWPLRLRGWALTAAVALAGAQLALWGHLPLPWFTGPLLAVAISCMLGAPLITLPYARDGGQWIIGTALGLYFTPQVVGELLRLAPWIVLNLVFCVMLGLAGAWLLRRATGESGTTCFFAMAIGGASEMAAQAERYGGAVDRVAAAHSLRIMLVALIVPLAMGSVGVQGSDAYAPAAAPFSAVGLAVLVAATGAGAAALLRAGAPNVFMIGPLLVAAVLTGAGVQLTSLPTPLVNGGQWLIGIALGTRFTPAFFRAAPRFLAAVAAITLLYLAVAAGFGVALAHAASLAIGTAVLATTPGGIGEMAITAKVLKLGAPIVTAFHAIRMAALVLMIGAVYRALRGRWR